MGKNGMVRIRFNGALLVIAPEEFIRALRRGKYLLRLEKMQERKKTKEAADDSCD